MKIEYEVNDQKHNIFIQKKIDYSVVAEIEKHKSDKKILFIYDDKIHQPDVDLIIKVLKNSGCDVSAYNFKGNKKK